MPNNPYPWKKERTYRYAIKSLKQANLFALLFAVLGSIVFSPLSAAVGVWLTLRYRIRNPHPRNLPILILMLAVLVSAVVYGMFQVNPVGGFIGVMSSFGDQATMTTKDALWAYPWGGLPLGVILWSLYAVTHCSSVELRMRRYLDKSAPTAWQKMRRRVAEKKFVSDATNASVLEVGVIADDMIPWRQQRRGQVVGAHFKNLKHGLVVGANGTGKTIAAVNLVNEYVSAGSAVLYPDFKGDLKTESMLAAVARERGVPFYSFWSNKTETGLHYDPLLGSLDESPASVVLTSFDFTTEGEASYYTNQIEKYLALQFRVFKEYSGKRDTESVFDWLLRTCTPSVLQEELRTAMANKDRDLAAKAKALSGEIKNVDLKALSGLEANLSKVVNTIGKKMRPQEHMIDLRQAVSEGAIVYFGLPSSGDKTVMRAMGSLLLRDVVSFTSDRFSDRVPMDHPLLVMPDEASQLGAKADTMLEVLSQGRSAGVFVIPVMQTFVQFSDTFISELLGNSPTAMIMRVTDTATATELSEWFGKTPVRTSRTSTTSDVDSFGLETTEATGAQMGIVDMDLRVEVDDITHLGNRQMLVYFPESPRRATVKRSFFSRVRKDEVQKDIPTVEVISREFILDAEGDVSITAEVLAETVGRNMYKQDRSTVSSMETPDSPSEETQVEEFRDWDEDGFDEPMEEPAPERDFEPEMTEVVDEPAFDQGASVDEVSVPSSEESAVSVEEAQPEVSASDFDDDGEQGEQEEHAVTGTENEVEVSDGDVKEYQGEPSGSSKHSVRKEEPRDDDTVWD